MNLHFNITNDHIKLMSLSDYPVSDSVNHLKAVFEFDEAWGGFTKTALFSNGNGSRCVLLENDECIIPWETLTGRHIYISVYGIKDDVRITATEVKIPLAPSGYTEGKNPEPPTPTVYEQLLEKIGQIGNGGSGEITDGSITSEKLADGAVTYSKLDDYVKSEISAAGNQAYEEAEEAMAAASGALAECGQLRQQASINSSLISSEQIAREEADAELSLAIQNASKIYVVTELPTEDLDRSGLYILVPEGPVMGTSGLVSDCLQLYVYKDDLEGLIPVGVTPDAINDALQFHYKPDGSGGSVDLSNYYTKEEADAALESSLEWTLIGETELTQEAIDEAGEDGITAVFLDLGEPVTEWYGETMIFIKVPKSETLNTAEGHIQMGFTPSENQPFKDPFAGCPILTAQGNSVASVRIVPSWTNSYGIKVDWINNYPVHSYIVANGYSSVRYPMPAGGTAGTPADPSSSHGLITGKRYFGVQAVNNIFKFPVNTMIKIYGRF